MLFTDLKKRSDTSLTSSLFVPPTHSFIEFFFFDISDWPPQYDDDCDYWFCEFTSSIAARHNCSDKTHKELPTFPS